MVAETFVFFYFVLDFIKEKIYSCFILLNEKMDWKSTKLTNILLFIIVCFFVVGALCCLSRMAFGHRVFEWKFGGCQMQWQYKNINKEASVWFEKKEAACPYAKQNIEATDSK